MDVPRFRKLKLVAGGADDLQNFKRANPLGAEFFSKSRRQLKVTSL